MSLLYNLIQHVQQVNKNQLKGYLHKEKFNVTFFVLYTGNLTVLKVQTIVVSSIHQMVRYEASRNFTRQADSLWCFNGTRASHFQGGKFAEFEEYSNDTGPNITGLNFTNITSGYIQGLLYLNEVDGKGCRFGTLHPISSSIGAIESACAIFINVLPGNAYYS